MLATEFERVTQNQFGIRYPVYHVNTKLNKEVKIRGLGTYISHRDLRFKADSASNRLLVEQLMDFPLAEHDDGPDALAMAIRLPIESNGIPTG
jgi:predicted phage terminase large subunit-like protein